MLKPIWISWHLSRRTRTLSENLGVGLVAQQREGGVISRHLVSFFWTLGVLIGKRPTTVFIQYSYLLLLAVSGYKTLSRYPVTIVCDCHTKALRRSISGRASRLYDWIKRKIFESVDICIISNLGQEKDVLKYSDNYMIVPDPIPTIEIEGIGRCMEEYVVIVCSFDRDEPVYEMMMAAREVGRYVNVYVTGAAPSHILEMFSEDKNIAFTGFISNGDYERLIADAKCLVSCTTEEGCLQSSGYEALAVGVPFVTSSTRALKSYFGGDAVFVDNEINDIVEGVFSAIKESDELKNRVNKLRISKVGEFPSIVNDLKTRVRQTRSN